MQYSPRVERISGKGYAAWAVHREATAAKRAGEPVIVMSVGDPDFATPAAITDKAVERLRAGDTHYSDILGRPALRAAIARDVGERGGLAIGPENVIVLAGAQNALFAASLCLFDSGDEVIAPEPIYLTYEATVGVSGAALVRIPPRADSGFRPDIDAMAEAVTPQTRAIMVANPNNPSGVVLTEPELEGIAALARRHDLWVIADEVYRTLTFEKPHLSLAALPDMAERTVTIGSLSKEQAMTGWRCGWMIGPEALIRHADKLSLCMLYGQPGFIQEAAIVALTEARGERDAMRAIYRHRRDLVHAALAQAPELSVVQPEAGMFVLVDVRRTGLSSGDFSWQLYRREKVSVLDAAAFGADGFVRIAFTVGEDELAEGCRRIRRFAAEARPDSV